LSSILDALKKLEKETSHGEPDPGWPDITRSARSRHQRRGAGAFRAAFFILIAAGLLAGGGLFFFGSTPDEADPGLENAPAPAPETPAPRKNADPAPQTQQAQPDTSDSVTVLRQPRIFPPVIEQKRPLKPIPGDLRIHPEKPFSPDPVIMPEKVSEDPAVAPETAPLKKPQPEPSVLLAFDQRDDPRIDLQAIAWAPGADNNFVVINNKIIREGGTVDGIKVIRIEKDSVAFQDGQKKWQQEFKIR
jgi:hypothetical protein